MERSRRAEQKQKNSAWSKEANRKTEKERRREKKARKREWQKAASGGAQTKLSSQNSSQGKGKRAKGGEDEDDWDELAREERMAKKVKKGTLDANVFDAEFEGL